MARSWMILALVLMILINNTYGGSWWSKKKSRSGNSCSYPTPRQGNYGYYSDFFYGSTSLSQGKKGKRVFVWSLKHSLILFRGRIFEWGIGSGKTYYMNRNPKDCGIKWKFSRKGSSRCLVSDIAAWTRTYRYRYGRYNLFSNNCHYFVNRLMSKLRSNCGR